MTRPKQQWSGKLEACGFQSWFDTATPLGETTCAHKDVMTIKSLMCELTLRETPPPATRPADDAWKSDGPFCCGGLSCRSSARLRGSNPLPVRESSAEGEAEPSSESRPCTRKTQIQSFVCDRNAALVKRTNLHHCFHQFLCVLAGNIAVSNTSSLLKRLDLSE